MIMIRKENCKTWHQSQRNSIFINVKGLSTKFNNTFQAINTCDVTNMFKNFTLLLDEIEV